MNFSINRDSLLNALNSVSKGLSNKTPLPTLTGIYLNVLEDKIIFITTNRELSIKVEVPANNDLQIENTGSCLIPGKYFVEIIKKVEGEKINISFFDDSAIKITTERSQFTLNPLDKNNFPKYSFDGAGEPIVFTSQDLKKIIRQTSFSASSSEQRMVLTGVNFEINGSELSITSTDSFRLSRKITSLKNTYDKKQINVPSKAIEELNKILEEDENEVKLYLISNKALFQYKNISFMTRLIEGTYPDVSSLFPKNYLFNITFNKNELVSAIERASLLTSNDNLSLVKLQVTDKQKVKILSASTEIGNVEEEVYPTQISEINHFTIAFSSKYLLEAVKSFESNEISINFTGEIKPFVVNSSIDQGLTQLILPVRIFN